MTLEAFPFDQIIFMCHRTVLIKKWLATLPHQRHQWPWPQPLDCELVTEASDVALLQMASGALAVASSPFLVTQKQEPGSPWPRIDPWLCSFLARGTAQAALQVGLQAHDLHYEHSGVCSALRAVPGKEEYLGVYQGTCAVMIPICPYGAIQCTVLEHCETLIATKRGPGP